MRWNLVTSVVLSFFILIGLEAKADPRLEEECHVPLMYVNTDAEVKLQNCQPEITAVGDQATGRFEREVFYNTPGVVLPIGTWSKVKGDETTYPMYDDYYTATDGGTCVLITRNWNNAAQAYAYTQFETRNWATSIVREYPEPGVVKMTYKVDCIAAQKVQ